MPKATPFIVVKKAFALASLVEAFTSSLIAPNNNGIDSKVLPVVLKKPDMAVPNDAKALPICTNR